MLLISTGYSLVLGDSLVFECEPGSNTPHTLWLHGEPFELLDPPVLKAQAGAEPVLLTESQLEP